MTVDAIAIITAIIALYGAVLSTVVAIGSSRSKRHKLVVTYGWAAHRAKSSFERMDVLCLTVTNFGRTDVVARLLGLEVPAMGAVITPAFLSDSEINKSAGQNVRLQPGDHLKAQFDVYELWQMVINMKPDKMPFQVRGQCEDTVGNVFFTDWIEIPHK